MLHDDRRRRIRNAHVLLILFVAAVSATWALLNPIGAVPDEPAHVVYAAGVVRGELGSGPGGDLVRIPFSIYTNVSGCYAGHGDIPLWKCPAPVYGASTLIDAPTSAAGYPPLYYAIVGWPTYLPFGPPAWYLMRLTSVALGVVLIGLPLWISRRRPASWFAVAGVVTITPMVAFLIGSINPNGAEIAAAIGMCLSVAVLARSAMDGDHRLVRRSAVSLAITAGYLAVARPYSYVEMIGLAVCLALVVPGGIGRRLRSPSGMAAHRGLWMALVAVAVLLVGAAAVYMLAHRTRGVATPQGLGPILAAAGSMTSALFGYLAETVGIFGWRDYFLPFWLMTLGVAAMLTVFSIGLAAGRARQRFGLVLIAAGAIVVGPTAAAVILWGAAWNNYQGRYALPLIVGMPIMGAIVAHFAGVRPAETGRRIAAAAVWVVLLTHVWGLWMTVIRYGSGFPLFADGTLDMREFRWFQGPVLTVLIVVGLVATVALTAMLGRSVQAPDGWPEPLLQPTAGEAEGEDDLVASLPGTGEPLTSG